MLTAPLLQFTTKGIYCPKADIYIDPWKRVDKAIITHAHSDHARKGNKYYLAHHTSAQILKLRLGAHIQLETVKYNEPFYKNGVRISLHPAGHIYGSAQVRLEANGEVWVVSGDYKTEPDFLSQPFEPVRCHTFITECTFGLPIYLWKPQPQIFNEINQWWKDNQSKGITSILFGYSLGKAQRLLCGLEKDIGDIFVHNAIWDVNEALRQDGAQLPDVRLATQELTPADYKGGIIITPPNGIGPRWMKKLSSFAVATASGWMAIRSTQRRREVDKGFVLSDHADWAGINAAIDATGAQRVITMHGYTAALSRYLNEKGLEAYEAEKLLTPL